MAMQTVIRRTHHSFLVLAMLVARGAARGVHRPAPPRPPPPRPPPDRDRSSCTSRRHVPSALRAGLVHKGDAVTSYKWIINQDDTGDPGTAAHPGTDKCLPASAGAGSSSNPDFADTCPWPSIRKTSGLAPIVAQGDQTRPQRHQGPRRPAGRQVPDLRHRRRLQDRRPALHGLWRHPDGDRRDEPDPAAARPLCASRCSTTTCRSTRRTRSTRSSRLQGFTAHLTDVFGTVSVDYYGNALCTHYLRELQRDPSHDETDRSSGRLRRRQARRRHHQGAELRQRLATARS